MSDVDSCKVLFQWFCPLDIPLDSFEEDDLCRKRASSLTYFVFQTKRPGEVTRETKKLHRVSLALKNG